MQPSVEPAILNDGVSFMKIATRLGIAISVPLVVFALLETRDIYYTWQTQSNAALLNRLAKGVIETSKFVHALQRERGMTVVVLGTKGAQMASELTAQRKATDEVEDAAVKFIGTLDDKDFDGDVSKARAAIAKIADMRSRVDSYSVTVPDAFAVYTTAVTSLLEVASGTAKFAEHGETTGAILAYVNLQEANERAGQERAGIAGGLSKGKFAPEIFARVIGLRAAQESYFDSFLAAATPKQRTFFQQTMAGPETKVVEQMRVIVDDGGMTGALKGLDAKTWFTAATGRMELITKVEHHVAGDLVTLTDGIASEAMRNMMIFAGGALTCFVLTLVVATLIARSVTGPLNKTREGIVELASGNFTVVIPNIHFKDEIGQIARAVDLIVKQLGDTIRKVKGAATEVTSASREIAAGADDLSHRTEEQAASLEETSAAMEEMTSTVRRNSDNAREASGSASRAAEIAERSSRIVADAVGAMARIEGSSRKIADIIVVIDEIARQTNLLALNAAVEAARAGEAGRGFAVVATEVRTLAQRSALAAKDINGLISASSDQVKEGVELVNNAGAALSEIVEAIDTVASTVADIAHASAEQSTGLEEINKALMQLDTATQRNSALVEESAATAKTLEHQADGMSAQVAVFRLNETDAAGAAGAESAPMASPAYREALSAPQRAGRPKLVASR
ncbi:MAG: HAMP domain-containing protein [Rhodopseudomonas sp.]|nr:HAMP domain-containing protein [Rhodopseudomonas sp.]